MSKSLHIADAEVEFKVVNVTPDFCIVDGQTVPFEIFRDLTRERLNYTKRVNARGVPVLTVKSVIAGVVGNMGGGVTSTVSQGAGDVLLILGVEKVRAEGNPVCRDQDLCQMNVKTG